MSADGEPVLHVELPREVTDPEAFKDVDLVPTGQREIIPTGLAPFSESLKSGFGILPRLHLQKQKSAVRA